MRHSSGVVDTYNEEIPTMRRAGYTLQRIGDVIGVTKERVRQILNKYYGGTSIPFMAEAQVAKACGCSSSTLAKLRKQGLIKPKHRGWFWLYDRDDGEKAYLALQRTCVVCGKPISPAKKKYCEECGTEYSRYPYPFFDQEGKKRAMERTMRWRKRHPEHARKLQQRAQKKYYEKRKAMGISSE